MGYPAKRNAEATRGEARAIRWSRVRAARDFLLRPGTVLACMVFWSSASVETPRSVTSAVRYPYDPEGLICQR